MSTDTREATQIDTKAVRHWTYRQRWGAHDDDGFDGYCLLIALCDEVDRLRAEGGPS